MDGFDTRLHSIEVPGFVGDLRCRPPEPTQTPRRLTAARRRLIERVVLPAPEPPAEEQ